jgi:hypothetical protein
MLLPVSPVFWDRQQKKEWLQKQMQLRERRFLTMLIVSLDLISFALVVV